MLTFKLFGDYACRGCGSLMDLKTHAGQNCAIKFINIRRRRVQLDLDSRLRIIIEK